MEGAFVTPIFDMSLIGTEPPTEGTHGFRAWQQRTPAQGAVIAGKEDRNLVLVLKLTDPLGHAKEVEVLYHDARGRNYRFVNSLRIGVTSGSPC